MVVQESAALQASRESIEPMNPSQPYAPMPIIVGVPRSGTTLLRLMLDSHRELAIPPETGFLGLQFDTSVDSRRSFYDQVTNYPPNASGWNDFGLLKNEFWEQLQAIQPFDISAGLRCFYCLYASRFGKHRFGDKTPGNSFSMPVIEQRLPEARFIHLIRDGRDVALSWRPLWFSPGKDIPTLAESWANWIRQTRIYGADCRHYCEIRFEELVAEPESILRAICDFLKLEFEGRMIRYYENSAERLVEHLPRVSNDGHTIISHEVRLQQQALTMQPVCQERAQNWQLAMTLAEQTEFISVAGLCLEEFGYSV